MIRSCGVGLGMLLAIVCQVNVIAAEDNQDSQAGEGGSGGKIDPTYQLAYSRNDGLCEHALTHLNAYVRSDAYQEDVENRVAWAAEIFGDIQWQIVSGPARKPRPSHDYRIAKFDFNNDKADEVVAMRPLDAHYRNTTWIYVYDSSDITRAKLERYIKKDSTSSYLTGLEDHQIADIAESGNYIDQDCFKIEKCRSLANKLGQPFDNIKTLVTAKHPLGLTPFIFDGQAYLLVRSIDPDYNSPQDKSDWAFVLRTVPDEGNIVLDKRFPEVCFFGRRNPASFNKEHN